MANELTYFQKKYLEEHFRSMSDKVIAGELGLKKSAIRKALKSMKLERSSAEERRVAGRDNDGSEKPDSMSRKTKGWIHLISIAIIIALTFAAYANSLGNDFIWDDEFLVRDNMYIRSFSHLKDIFTSYLASSSGNINNFYRPLQDLSYMIDYFLWGYDPMGFRLTNIILHSLCAALIYILMTRILGDYRPALLAGLFFGVHPINTEAVTYIAGRADPLYLVFFLSSFILFLKVIAGLKDGQGVRRGLYIFSLLCYALSILSKEIAVILPLMLLLYYVVFLKGAGISVKSRVLCYPYISIFVIYAILRKTILDFSNLSPSFLMARFNLFERLLTSFKAVIEYLRLLVLPIGLHMERTIKVATSLLEPNVMAALIIMTALAAGLIYAYKRHFTKALFVSAWFFVGLFPVSNIIPINSFIAEHWLYLPSIGIFSLAGMAIVGVRRTKLGKGVSGILVILISVAILIFYTKTTIERNKVWRDEIVFFKDTIKNSPASSRLHLNFGNTYSERGMPHEALKEYKKAAELRPNFALAYGNMGAIYIDLGDYEKAEAHIRKALGIKDDYPDAWFNLGAIYDVRNDSANAEKYYKRAVKLKPDFLICHTRLAALYLTSGDMRGARFHWNEVLRINPRNKEAKRLLERYSGKQ